MDEHQISDSGVILLLIFTTLVILLLIFGIIIILNLSNKRYAEQQIVIAQARAAYESELRTIESEVQEATFTHLATELHDNIGQLLAVTHMQIEKEKLHHSDMAHLFTPAGETLQTIIEQVRLLSHSLSSDLVSEGLQRSIAQEVKRLDGIGRLTIHFDTDGVEPDVSKDVRMVAFRIFQEAVSNALRHAGATNLSISLKGESFLLQVRDDGQGFDTEAALNSSHGLGIKSMLRRASIAGLQCDIVSGVKNGCELTLTHKEEIV